MDDVAIDVEVLGPLAVRVDGEPVVLGGRARTLLSALIARRGATVPADVLAEAVWPTDAPSDARNALQALVSRLRRVLGPAGDCVVTDPAGYRLALPPGATDADRFEQVVSTARTRLADDAAGTAAALADALALWRGDPFTDAADDPAALSEATRLGELRLEAVELHAEAVLSAGGGSEIIGTLRPLALDHPARERLHRALAHALYRAGRQDEALEVLASLRRRLRDDLGLDPAPATVAIQQAILDHDPSLGAAPSAPPPSDPTPPGRPAPRPPAPRTSFVGRERELAEVRARLSEARLLTLVGPGGTGKSRLALEAVRDPLERPLDSVAVVELAAIADPGDVPAHVATAVGVPAPVRVAPAPGVRPTPTRPLAERLSAHLADRDVLVVLDNCEHVLDAAAAVADALLHAGPGVQVLATSREALHLPGEALFPVTPLGLPPVGESDPARLLEIDAVRLFVDRARTADPAFQLDRANAAVVGEICRRLDGVPLALELAAARIATVPAHLLEARLSDRFRLLTGGDRTVQRQRTLEAVVAWSHDLLDERQRVVLRRLGVFATPPAIDVAESVCSGDDIAGEDVLPTLAELADKSMVELASDAADTRVRMLETIREFARTRLEEQGSEADAVRDRHAEQLARRAAAAATGLQGAEQLVWLDRLDREHDDMRAALERLIRCRPDRAQRMASDLAWFWWLHDHVAEGVRWLERAVAADGEPAPHAAVAWGWLGLLRLFARSHPGDSAAAAEEARTHLDRHGAKLAPSDRATVSLLAAYVRLVVDHDPGTAVAEMDAALALAREAGNRWIETAVHFARAVAAANTRQSEMALAESQRALELAEVTGDRWARFQTHELRAGLRTRAGDYAAARTDLTTAVTLAREIGALEQVRGIRCQRAMLSMLDGDLDGATRELDEVLADVDSPRDAAAAFARQALGMVAHRAGDYEAAVAHHREAADALLAMGERHGAAEALAGIAFARAAQGEAAAATAAVDSAVALVRGLPPGSTWPLLLEAAAAAALAAGEPEVALQQLGRAAALREPQGLVAGERWHVDRIEAGARAQLGDAVADTALAAGRERDDLLPAGD